MFIAVNAKADIKGSKKGKLTPAQNAQINAWCLADKTGILDCLGRCEATSTTYSAMSNEAIVDFHNGYIVICGRLIECEEGSTVKIVTPLSGSVDGKIILRYDLNNSGENEFVVTTTSSALVQQDLNENPLTGIYEFELYSYTATQTQVSLVRNNTNYISDVANKIANLTTLTSPLSDYDTNKGTIEQRLTNLGFRSGSVTMTGGTASSQSLTRQGNYCLFSLTADVGIKIESSSTTVELARLTTGFLPSAEIESYAKCTYTVFSPDGNSVVVVGNVKITITRGAGIVKLSEFSEISSLGGAVYATKVEIKNIGYSI